MMSDTIDGLTVNYEEEGVLKVKELDKVVLSKGAWTTIMFRFLTWDAVKNIYKGPAYAIRRYQKRDGNYQMKSKFNISSNDQAQKIIDTLSQWLAEPPVEGAAAETESD